MSGSNGNGNGNGAGYIVYEPRESPSAQLRTYLARYRKKGTRFDAAWVKSVRQIAWPHDTDQRRWWRAALRETRPEWKACYLNEMTPTAKRMHDFETARRIAREEADREGAMWAATL